MSELSEERLTELRDWAGDIRTMMDGDSPSMQEEERALGLADAVDEIDRLRAEVDRLTAAAHSAFVAMDNSPRLPDLMHEAYRALDRALNPEPTS